MTLRCDQLFREAGVGAHVTEVASKPGIQPKLGHNWLPEPRQAPDRAVLASSRLCFRSNAGTGARNADEVAPLGAGCCSH